MATASAPVHRLMHITKTFVSILKYLQKVECYKDSAAAFIRHLTITLEELFILVHSSFPDPFKRLYTITLYCSFLVWFGFVCLL